MKEALKELKEEMTEIVGRWDGDNPGYEEDQADIANEIIEKADELVALINKLNGTNQN
jgi:hypothetical protein